MRKVSQEYALKKVVAPQLGGGRDALGRLSILQ